MKIENVAALAATAVQRHRLKALAMASKIEKYVKNPNYGAWRNKVMIIADDGDNGNHLAQAEAVYDNLRSFRQRKELSVRQTVS